MRLRSLWIWLGIPMFMASTATAQNAITFDEFATRIDPYFAPELVQDVRQALPQTAFDVWGYDVGDFSDDGHKDLALTIRQRNDNKRRINVFFFVDDEGTLKLIKQTTVDFVELPIEVGVGIRNGNAYLVRKLKEFEWEIFGYRFRNGVLMMVDRFDTERQEQLTHETYRNYQSLEGYERYLNITNDQEVFRSNFLTLPSYGRGRDVTTGYQATATIDLSKYIQSGTYYWTGENDASLNIRSAFDEEFLYFNIVVRDDQIVPLSTEGDSATDRLEIWLDMYAQGDRFRSGKRARDFRTKTDSNIYAFHVGLGDFIDMEPKVRIATSNRPDESQNTAAKRLRAVASRQDSGYTVKLRVPFALLGYSSPPVDDGTLMEFGMTVVLHDVDNQFRPEETTTLSSSEKFEELQPATFGSIVLIPGALHYGDAVNIHMGDLKERLQEVGF